jgi:hypothetical protein
MDINLGVVISVLFIHWVADFVFQTDEQAKGKSCDNWMLTKHVLTYTLTFLIAGALFCSYSNHILHKGASDFGLSPKIGLFLPITFIAHWITDYFTSRLNSKLYKSGRTHKFFVSIGFDQFLHFFQLLLTFQLLAK